MTKDELRNHLADILDDQSPLPREQSLDAYTDALWKTLLYQLQKARQDWLREEIVRLEGMKHVAQDKDGLLFSETNYNQALQTIIDRYHSELDQDKTNGL